MLETSIKDLHFRRICPSPEIPGKISDKPHMYASFISSIPIP